MKNIENFKDKSKFYLKKIFNKNLLNPTNYKQDFLSYIDIEDFNGNFEFENLINSITDFKGNGIVKFEGANCKTAEIKTKNGDNYYVSSYVRNHTEQGKTEKYIVFKPNTTINSIGNVWEKWGKGKKIFVLENCPFETNKGAKIISVISILEDGYKETNFYDKRGNWFGKNWCEIQNAKTLPYLKQSIAVKTNAVINEDCTNLDALIFVNELMPDTKNNTNPINLINKELHKRDSKIKRLSVGAMSKKQKITVKDLENTLNANQTLDKFL